MEILGCTVMPYPWGSRTAIASLTGRAVPSAGPEAELWMGAHPVAPSTVSRSGRPLSLGTIIGSDPEPTLGGDVVRAFGPRLPFLLKVLAAAEPLSLQAHPTAERARAGFADEDERSIPRDAPTRNYKDPSHKPELLCALTPFEALSGFRRIDDTLRLFDLLAVPEVEPALRSLRAAPNARGLAETFRALMTMPMADRQRAVDATVDACARAASAFVRERALAGRLAALYPGDIGVVSALLLELVHLEPGEAIYLGAGNLHAYLEGTGIEIMASSDNVLRGGLTKKHVDVPELLRVLDFDGGAAQVVRPRALDAFESVYDTPAVEFRLSLLRVADPLTRQVSGPEILFVTEGAVRVTDGRTAGIELSKGAALFVAASTRSYNLAGEATIYRATTNIAPPT